MTKVNPYEKYSVKELRKILKEMVKENADPQYKPPSRMNQQELVKYIIKMLKQYDFNTKHRKPKGVSVRKIRELREKSKRELKAIAQELKDRYYKPPSKMKKKELINYIKNVDRDYDLDIYPSAPRRIRFGDDEVKEFKDDDEPPFDRPINPRLRKKRRTREDKKPFDRPINPKLRKKSRTEKKEETESEEEEFFDPEDFPESESEEFFEPEEYVEPLKKFEPDFSRAPRLSKKKVNVPSLREPKKIKKSVGTIPRAPKLGKKVVLPDYLKNPKIPVKQQKGLKPRELTKEKKKRIKEVKDFIKLEHEREKKRKKEIDEFVKKELEEINKKKVEDLLKELENEPPMTFDLKDDKVKVKSLRKPKIKVRQLRKLKRKVVVKKGVEEIRKKEEEEKKLKDTEEKRKKDIKILQKLAKKINEDKTTKDIKKKIDKLSEKLKNTTEKAKELKNKREELKKKVKKVIIEEVKEEKKETEEEIKEMAEEITLKHKFDLKEFVEQYRKIYKDSNLDYPFLKKIDGKTLAEVKNTDHKFSKRDDTMEKVHKYFEGLFVSLYEEAIERENQERIIMERRYPQKQREIDEKNKKARMRRQQKIKRDKRGINPLSAEEKKFKKEEEKRKELNRMRKLTK